MNFYTQVLSKFASDKNVKLTVKIEVSIEGEVSQQRRDETKVALQELGLNDEVDVLEWSKLLTELLRVNCETS